jgi:recombination protein RecR
MGVLPKALEETIEALGALPGVGPRSAERYAYWLLRADSAKSQRISSALSNLKIKTKYCPVTFALIDEDEEFSPLYTKNDRDKQIVAVVADPFDIIAIERTGQFKGTYHVLGGLISPIDGISPESLNIDPLVRRIAKDKVKELILATNASVEGESTSLYIAKRLENAKVKVTRLARGLPIGLDLEYADQITLGRALEGRQIL